LSEVMPEPTFRLTHLSDGAAEDPINAQEM
jgi:hypothetical protein